jgi:ligand-binding sensor domain-containing protein
VEQVPSLRVQNDILQGRSNPPDNQDQSIAAARIRGVHSIAGDRNGTVYVTAQIGEWEYPEGMGLLISRDGGKSFFLSRRVRSFTSVFVDSKGLVYLWDHQGVVRSEDRGHSFRSIASLRNEWLTSFFVDQNGVIYAGNYGSMSGLGISRDGGKSFTAAGTLKDVEWLEFIYVDQKGIIYLGLIEKGKDGLAVSENGGKSFARRKFPAGGIESISGDSNGTVFVGTRDRGLFVCRDNGTTFSEMKGMTDPSNDFSGSMILNVHVDQDGNVYAGTPLGIFVSRDGGKSFKNVGLAKFADKIFVDQGGTIFCEDSGVYRLNVFHLP